MSTFAIGDIHGGLKALKQLFTRMPLQENDTLIFLGDYVDGWSESFELIEYLLELQKKCACIFIKGNHDVWCEEWLKNDTLNPVWLKHGGQATVKSYQNCSGVQLRKHISFFEGLHYYFIDESDRLFVHAGFTSMSGPQHELSKENCLWDRTLIEMAVVMDKMVKKDSLLYPKRLKLFSEIFIGHTPTQYYDVHIPMQVINIWDVDTGAAFKGKLSAINVDTKEFWQSDKLIDLYTGEKGRN